MIVCLSAFLASLASDLSLGEGSVCNSLQTKDLASSGRPPIHARSRRATHRALATTRRPRRPRPPQKYRGFDANSGFSRLVESAPRSYPSHTMDWRRCQRGVARLECYVGGTRNRHSGVRRPQRTWRFSLWPRGDCGRSTRKPYPWIRLTFPNSVSPIETAAAGIASATVTEPSTGPPTKRLCVAQAHGLLSCAEGARTRVPCVGTGGDQPNRPVT